MFRLVERYTDRVIDWLVPQLTAHASAPPLCTTYCWCTYSTTCDQYVINCVIYNCTECHGGCASSVDCNLGVYNGKPVVDCIG